VSDSLLSESLAELSRFLVGDKSVEETLNRVLDLTVEAVVPADMVAITMIVEGRQRTAAFTDDLAPELDQTQYDNGHGPCLDAFKENRVTEIHSTREHGEWPEFRKAAADHGILSTLSLPLVVDKATLGAMNLYSRRERAFGLGDRTDAELFAAQAAIVLANSHAYWDAHQLSTGLAEAMRSRAVIEQAKGILMGAEGVDEEEAFSILARASQRENVKLREIAQRIVHTATTRRRDAKNGSPS
jgi:transcriptional regulator with GAF, ATPase, and Fis domain